MTALLTPVAPVQTSLLTLDEPRFRADFDRRPFVIGHHLADHPLFALPRLVELAETIRRIEECRSWLVLKFVETDPEYSDLLDRCLAEIAAVAEPLRLGMDQRESFIFVSSPGSVTPYHIDPECNFLLQIRGSKTVHQFPADDRALISEEELERFFTAFDEATAAIAGG